MKVKHSVAIRVISSSEDLHFVSTPRVLHCLLTIYNLCYVEIGDGFSCKRSNGNELWSLLVVRNHVAKHGIPFLLGLDGSCGTTVGRSRGRCVLRRVDGIV